MKQEIEKTARETYLTTNIQTNSNVFNTIAVIHIISHTLCNSSSHNVVNWLLASQYKCYK